MPSEAAVFFLNPPLGGLGVVWLTFREKAERMMNALT